MRKVSAIAIVGALLSGVPFASAEATLYRRPGGFDAIATVADDFLARL